MYVGGKQGAKVSGSWYKGKILNVGAPVAPDKQDFDPWQSVTVEWDKAGVENTQGLVGAIGAARRLGSAAQRNVDTRRGRKCVCGHFDH